MIRREAHGNVIQASRKPKVNRGRKVKDYNVHHGKCTQKRSSNANSTIQGFMKNLEREVNEHYSKFVNTPYNRKQRMKKLKIVSQINLIGKTLVSKANHLKAMMIDDEVDDQKVRVREEEARIELIKRYKQALSQLSRVNCRVEDVRKRKAVRTRNREFREKNVNYRNNEINYGVPSEYAMPSLIENMSSFLKIGSRNDDLKHDKNISNLKYKNDSNDLDQINVTPSFTSTPKVSKDEDDISCLHEDRKNEVVFKSPEQEILATKSSSSSSEFQFPFPISESKILENTSFF